MLVATTEKVPGYRTENPGPGVRRGGAGAALSGNIMAGLRAGGRKYVEE